MRIRRFNIALLILLVFTKLSVCGQNTSEQDDYLNSTQEKHSFNKKKWHRLKKGIIRESEGQFGTEPSNDGGNFYNYDEEGYDGEFSEYKNDDEDYNYESNDAYNEGNDIGDGEGGGYYYPEDDIEKGQQEYHPKEEQEYKKRRVKKSNSNYDGDGLGNFQYVFYVILAALFAFLLYQLFMKSSFDNKGKKVTVSYEEMAPTEIPKSELELLLEKAITSNDFRGAIRIYFIFIIKDLSEKEWIRWEKKKTNFSYLIEMRNRSQYDSFNKAVSIYELVWYGNYSVKKDDFNTLEPHFKDLLIQLNSGQIR